MKTKLLLPFLALAAFPYLSSCDSEHYEFEINQHKNSTDVFHNEMNDYTNFFFSKQTGIFKMTDSKSNTNYFFAKSSDNWTFWCVMEKTGNFEELSFGKNYVPKTFMAVDSNQVVHYIKQEWEDSDVNGVWSSSKDSPKFINFQVEYPSRALRLQSVACERAKDYKEKQTTLSLKEERVGEEATASKMFVTFQKLCSFGGKVPYFDEMTAVHTVFTPEENNE